MLDGRVIIVGVTGSIAAYKAAELTRLLVKSGAGVRVVMTDAATRFITPLTMQTLSRHPVAVDMFAPPSRWEVEHIELAGQADLVVVAPASANAIARLAHGLADDMLTTVALAACGRGRPLFVAPAMNRSMLDNPLTQDNIDRLRRFGARIIASESGELACGEYGDGRMADPSEILRVISATREVTPWTGRTVLVSAGPTREHIDTVRYLSNPSSGKMGFALACALRDAGAAVAVIAGPVTEPAPGGVEIVSVVSADDMAAALRARAVRADAIFMAAAVADATPVERRVGKASKSELFAGGIVRVRPTIDILRTLADDRGPSPRPLLVGFAAYADWDSVGHKLKAKGADMIVANDITEPGSGFNTDTNRVTLLFPDGRQEPLPPQSKIDAARAIIKRAASLL